MMVAGLFAAAQLALAWGNGDVRAPAPPAGGCEPSTMLMAAPSDGRDRIGRATPDRRDPDKPKRRPCLRLAGA